LYHSKLDENKFTFIIWYNIFGKENIKCWNEYKKNNPIKLPITWRHYSGGGGAGPTHKHEQYTYSGPESDKDEAINVVRKLYEGYNGQIKWEMTNPTTNPEHIVGNYNDNEVWMPIFEGDSTDPTSNYYKWNKKSNK